MQSKIVIIYGPPGIGKTSHALELAYIMKEKEFNIQWFNSETKDKFNTGLQFLNKLVNPNPDEKPTFEDMIKFLKNELSQANEKKFLFILDNLVYWEMMNI